MAAEGQRPSVIWVSTRNRRSRVRLLAPAARATSERDAGSPGAACSRSAARRARASRGIGSCRATAGSVSSWSRITRADPEGNVAGAMRYDTGAE